MSFVKYRVWNNCVYQIHELWRTVTFHRRVKHSVRFLYQNCTSQFVICQWQVENPNPQAYLCVLNNLISSQSGQLKAAGYHNKVCQPLLDKTSKSSIVLYEGNKDYGLEFSWHYKAITGLKLFFIAIRTLFFIT